ncbi:MAG: DUF1826 domain-containing protein [Pseudomonadota bacterium]
MSHVEEMTCETSPVVAQVSSAQGLSAIRQPGCGAAIWHREPPAGFQQWIDTLDERQLPQARVILRPRSVRTAVSETCEAAGTPDCPERTALIDDISALSDAFARMMDVPYIRLRLDVVTNNMCAKFHVDGVTARLICTYRGTGTQYGVSARGGEPDAVSTAPTGAPILLRGTRWPQTLPHEETARVLHRSPPIAGTGETRLLLVLDPISECDARQQGLQPSITQSVNHPVPAS